MARRLNWEQANRIERARKHGMAPIGLPPTGSPADRRRKKKKQTAKKTSYKQQASRNETRPRLTKGAKNTARQREQRVANVLASLPHLLALPSTSRWRRKGLTYQQHVLSQIRALLESLRRHDAELLNHPTAMSAQDLLARFHGALPVEKGSGATTTARLSLTDSKPRQARAAADVVKERRPTGVIVRRRGGAEQRLPTDAATKPSVRRFTNQQWEWFVTTSQLPYSITGKYLFLAADRMPLVSIALNELQAGRFHLARTQAGDRKDVPEFVLGLYHQDASRGAELAERYRGRAGVRFRSWQADNRRSGTQSHERFLRFLTREEQVRSGSSKEVQPADP